MNPKKPKAKVKRPSRVQRRLKSVVRCYPDKLWCVFQGESLTPFDACRHKEHAVALVTVANNQARDYHMAEYRIAIQEPAISTPHFPPNECHVVCLCGSTRFRDEFTEANRRETMAGRIVVAPGVFAHSGDPLTDDDKRRLDALHLRKIDMADSVLVINPGGYIGDSTRREIDYAMRTGKPVGYTHNISREPRGSAPGAA